MALSVGKLRFILNRCTIKFMPTAAVQFRQSSFRSSPFVCDLDGVKTNYEVTQSPEDWKYVERILPPVTVPDPVPRKEYPSEWKPQAENLQHLPYFVPRTKSHMIPVYLKTSQRGQKRLTYVRRVQGDIWLLEKELREFLQKETIRPLSSQVNELVRYICFRGDHVNAIKYWLMKKEL